jgi:hypothetical protein
LRVSENTVLREISERKREEMAGGWRRLHKEEVHNLYTSPDFIRVIKRRRVRWIGHVACTEGIRNTKFSSENLKGRNH